MESNHRPRRALKIGFIDLIDAAPLIVATELGCFAEEGLDVTLERQLGWGNIRDKLTFGQLDAAHALLGMPLFSQIHRDWFIEPLLAVMNLGWGGNAITLSNRLVAAGVQSAESLREYIRKDPAHEVLAFGHVFSCSMHHYLLREWLSSAGINPDRDVRLRVFPPNQMAGLIAQGQLDGFCAGEPWNTLTHRSGGGKVVAFTVDILPRHPEKVLAVSRRWMRANADLLEPMIRALLRACEFCQESSNRDRLISILARPEYLNLPEPVLRESLYLKTESGPIRSFAAEHTFPDKSAMLWMARQLARWKHLPNHTSLDRIAAQCVETAPYRAAAASLGIECPPIDYPKPISAGAGQESLAAVFDPTIHPTHGEHDDFERFTTLSA